MGNYINLRPNNFDEFFGQEQIVKELKVYIYSAIKRGDTLDHLLFFGPSGTGKSTHTNLWKKLLNVSFLNGDLNVITQDESGTPIVEAWPRCAQGRAEVK